MVDIETLAPFFEDNYAEIHVRAYAKLTHVSPPTASKLLALLQKKGLLVMRTDKRHDLYKASRTGLFARYQQLYWSGKLQELVSDISAKEQCVIVLYGSITKAEATMNSDVDLVVIGTFAKIELSAYEKRLRRKIHVLHFQTFNDVPEHLKNGIQNGYVLVGGPFYGLERM